MDSKNGKDVAFVQCFQQFYDGIKGDPFGNQWVAAFEYIIRGMGGTNTFHRRSDIYGLYSDELQYGRKGHLFAEFVKSATRAMEWSDYFTNGISPSNFIEEAIRISDCGYEYGTDWGKKVIWINIRGCTNWFEYAKKRLEIRVLYIGSNCLYGLRSRRISHYNDPTTEMVFRPQCCLL
ncbi:hypothetical protein TSUD_305530 [Trifolium subterraneum]|uniref:Uncharacterized protein n=1 Tax=Trifolium subterraneum TaxID=3900 RepID=A0A2Z6LVY7_TRISU|nr:hypothetical protein TSUD_305530 [Trifolium subterraneum]